MTTYNHAMYVAWEVPGSNYEDAYECIANEPEKVLEALRKRVEELAAGELAEAVDSFDTYEEV